MKSTTPITPQSSPVTLHTLPSTRVLPASPPRRPGSSCIAGANILWIPAEAGMAKALPGR